MAVLNSRFDQALLLATELHRDQTRKGSGAPYVSHLLAVAALVVEHGGEEDVAVAALLHDAVEDQGGDPVRRRIREQFGERVAALVEGCTDTDEIPKPPWQARKEAFIAELGGAPPEVCLIVACDKLHNASATLDDLRVDGEAVWSKFKGGRDGTLWYLRSVMEIIEPDLPQRLAGRLRRTIEELENES